MIEIKLPNKVYLSNKDLKYLKTKRKASYLLSQFLRRGILKEAAETPNFTNTCAICGLLLPRAIYPLSFEDKKFVKACLCTKKRRMRAAEIIIKPIIQNYLELK